MMSKREFLIFVFKWKRTIFGTFFLVVGLVTSLAYLLPQDFKSVAKIIVESNRAPTDRATFTRGSESSEVLATESSIVTSRAVFEQVIDDLQLTTRGKPPGKCKSAILAFKGALQDLGLIPKLSKRESWYSKLDDYVVTKPVVGSNVLSIFYYDDNPEQASEILNSILDHYIQHHFALYNNQGTTDLYLQQMAKAKTRLAEKSQQLIDFKLKHSKLLLENKSSLLQETSRLKTDRDRLTEDYKDLLQRFAPDHPTAKMAQNRIENIDENIENKSKNLIEYEAYEAKLRELERDMMVEEQPFESFKTRYNDSRMSEAESSALVNVRILDRANVPEKASMSRLFMILISILAGVVLGFSFAFIKESYDRGTFDPVKIEALLGVQELGSLPIFKIKWLKG